MSSTGVARLAACIGVACLMWAAVIARTGRSAVAPLPFYGAVPDFVLTDQGGHSVRRGSLAGSVWVADFIFTRCAGQCPLMSSRMAQLQQAFADLPDVRLVSFTVDPEHDTADILADYARHYGASESRWRLLTGEREAIWRLAREGFRLGVSEDGTAKEPITHSVRLVLVDRDGRTRGAYDAMDAAAVARLRDDVRRLVKETGAARRAP